MKNECKVWKNSQGFGELTRAKKEEAKKSHKKHKIQNKLTQRKYTLKWGSVRQVYLTIMSRIIVIL